MRWFNNLRIMTKLVVSFGLVLALLVAVGALGLSTAADGMAALEITVRRDMAGLDATERAQIARLRMARATRHGMLMPDDAAKQQSLRDLDREAGVFRQHLEEIQASALHPETRARVEEMRRMLLTYQPLSVEAVHLASSDMPKAVVTLTKANEIGDAMSTLADTIARDKSALARGTYEQNEARYQRARTTLVGMVLLSLALAALVTLVAGRAVSRPLHGAVAVLDRVAAGDLTAHLDVDSTDEVGMMAAALNKSLAAMRSTLVGVRDVSVDVSTAASQLASAADQISSGAQAQAASLEETAASLEEISSTVKQASDHAQHAAQLANGARDSAERGGQVVESAVSAMSEITKSSKKIADIITTIDEIAFQTNLLALNAAVEAARAGEQGRGFGVVAAEVRTLAQRTASAAKEIRGLIADASSKVEVGTEQVNQSGETLAEIVRSVKRVTDMIGEIASAAQEQNTGIDQVNTAVAQADQVTQANASQTEELSATATSLAEKSKDLQHLVRTFQLGDGRAASDEPARQAVAEAARAPTMAAEPRAGRLSDALRAPPLGRPVARIPQSIPPRAPAVARRAQRPPARQVKANGFEEF